MLFRKAPLESDAADDVTLVHAAKQGDMAAFGELVHRHTPLIFRVAMHVLRSREDAEDVVQDAFLKAWQNLPAFEERARFSTWLTRIAVNTALMKLRSLRLTPVSLDLDADESGTSGDKVADWKPNPEELYSQAELREILQRALKSLPYGYRVVFLLRDVEGLSLVETAEMLGLTVSNVKARLFRARLKLREQLSRYFERTGNARASSLPLHRIVNELRAQAEAF
ncbi:MAG TPA: sigma-70 family RNA polymerase sigma factor [Terriglobales bacterium]|jgi:RNA polymerase sigma-70 factor (ECF subfamily)|nr:sigma-70 family RNA polymerase sigma factor [Terriglobales bacterium]